MKIKKIAAILTAGVLMAGMTACGGGSSTEASKSDEKSASVESSAVSEGSETAESSQEAETGDKELKEIDVVLDWYPNAIHTFLYEAANNGYFEEEGLKVNLISPAESIDAITFVASGKAQIGLTYPVEIVQANENDMPVKALAAVAQKPLGCLCSLKENTDVTSDMSSLKGKKVGYSGTAAGEAVIRTITRNAGLEDSDYELINVGFDLVTSLTTKSVDIVGGTFINDEVVTMENAGYELNVYNEEDYGVPLRYGLVMAVNDDAYNADPETYKAFLRACDKGFQDMIADEDAALDVIMNDMNSDDNPLDEVQQRESYEILIKLMQTDDAKFLSMSDDTWQAVIDWMNESGLADTELTAKDITIQD